MTSSSLAQCTVWDDAARIAVRLPLGDVFGALHPDGCFALVEDPRAGACAVVVGMMVLRPAMRRWGGVREGLSPGNAIGEVDDWCYDVAGVGGSWPISGGNAVDALRLALQYGTVDAVMAGAATIAREGVVAGARNAHLWQPYTPLGWASLAPHRALLEPAIADVRSRWQELGVLSSRRYPAQVAVSLGGDPALLDARIFHDRHPDGSPIEGYVLTSEAGAERLREGAAARGLRADSMLLAVSPPDDPQTIDIARVGRVLRERLDARLVEHDGGALSLGGFVDAGAVTQLNLTLMGGRSVRDVVAASTRVDAAAVLADWVGRPRLFALPKGWTPVYAVQERGGEALVVSFGPETRPNRCESTASGR